MELDADAPDQRFIPGRQLAAIDDPRMDIDFLFRILSSGNEQALQVSNRRLEEHEITRGQNSGVNSQRVIKLNARDRSKPPALRGDKRCDLVVISRIDR